MGIEKQPLVKKTLLFLFSVLVFASCTTSDLPDSSTEISVDEALASLNNVLVSIQQQTKSEELRNISEVITIKRNDIFSDSSNEKILYVVNYSDDNGFALLAADRRMPDPIIAIVEKGSLDKDLHFHNSVQTKSASNQDSISVFIENLLNGYIVYIHDGGGFDNGGGDGNGGTGGGGGGQVFQWEIDSTIAPVMRQYYWGQREGFNYYCPVNSDSLHIPAGCVPVAVAMIMTHNQFPTTLVLNGHSVSWDLAHNARYYSNFYEHNSDSTSVQVLEAAYLIRQIGLFCGTWYHDGDWFLTNDFGFTFPEKAKDFLNDIGYNATKHNGYDDNLIIPMLASGKPVFIAAVSSPANGHAWVIDGAIFQSYGSQTRKLLHCNWGAFGFYNGYYVSEVFDWTQGAVQTNPNYDEYSTGTGPYCFDHLYRIITY